MAEAAVAQAAWDRAELQDFRGRVRGCLLGGAIGDALGASVESDTLQEIRAAHGPQGITGFTPAFGRRGAVTDDTQLALFTMDGLIRAHVRRDTGAWHPPTDVHAAYRRWYRTQTEWGPDERRTQDGWLARQEWLYAERAPARACLTGLADDRRGTVTEPKNPASGGSAALTRSAPFGLLRGWDPQLVFQLSAECAAQTHGHPTAQLSAGAFAVIVHALVLGDDLDAAVQRSLAQLAVRPGHEATTEAIRQALGAVRQGMPGPERIASLGEGWTATEALAIGLYCALVADDMRHGMLLAVNHDGDSDTTAALSGSLLGALHGETALPPDLLVELEGRSTILELCDDFTLELTQHTSLHSPGESSPGWLERYPR